MLFHISEACYGDTTVLSLIGDADLANLPTLATRLSTVDTKNLTLDLDSVDYFDPICLGVLVAAKLRTELRGGDFTVRCKAGRTRDMILRTGMAGFIDLEDLAT